MAGEFKAGDRVTCSELEGRELVVIGPSVAKRYGSEGFSVVQEPKTAVTWSYVLFLLAASLLSLRGDRSWRKPR